MNHTFLAALSALMIVSTAGADQQDPAFIPAGDKLESSSLELWYDQPASLWTEALPVGNGRLGAMCFGGVADARIQLNEETVWAGPPTPEPNPQMRDAMAAARQAWFAGDYQLAHQVLQPAMGQRISPRSYQTLGDLRIAMTLPTESTNYRRQLDLDTAIATTTFACDDVTYTRQVFASPVEDVLVVHLTADKIASISLRATLDRPADFTTSGSGDGTLMMAVQANMRENTWVSDGKRHTFRWVPA